MHDIATGIRYLMEGFSLITKPGLRRFVLIPLMINILLFVGLFMVLWHMMGEFNHWFAHYLPAWLHWIGVVLWILLIVGFFLIFIYTFVTVASVIAAPFNSLLAEKVEYYLTGKVVAQRGILDNMRDVPRLLGRQLAILAYYLPRAMCIVILFFIPIVQAVAALLWFLFNAWFMTLTYMDYPADNHHVSFQALQSWLKQRRFVSFGFGLSVAIVAMIPIVNFFTVPAAVAGATKFWVENSR